MKNAQEAQIIKKITDKFDDVIIKVSFMTKNPHRLKKGICSALDALHPMDDWCSE